MPNGMTVEVTYNGKCSLSSLIILHDVLLVPEIKFHLLNVSKLIGSSSYNVSFTNKGCYLQDQNHLTSLWVGYSIQGLYKVQFLPTCMAMQ